MIAVLLAALMQGASPAAAPPARPSVITNPDWERRPTGQDMGSYYPVQAARAEISGSATLACSVTAAGTLADCKITQEYPTGYGFGDAALRLSTLFKMRAQTRDGVPVGGGSVRIPIRFGLPGGGLDPLSGMFACYGQTAAAAQRNPDDAQANYGFAFFAAQVALREAQSKTTPEAFEHGLAYARETAFRNEEVARQGPSLSQCLALIPDHK